MEPKQKTMGQMADVLKRLYAEDLSPGPRSPKKNGRGSKALDNRKRMYILVGTLVAIMLAAFIVSYNQIITYRELAYSNRGRVVAEMQRRNNLFDNLVTLYLSYTNLEREIFTHIAEVRSQLKETKKLMQKIKGQAAVAPVGEGALKPPVKSIDLSLSRLMAVVEQYPSLKSFEPHKTLINNIVLTENRIATERGTLNMSIRKYNNMIAIFPYKFMAYALGFERMQYFDIESGLKLPPMLEWEEFMHLREDQEALK